MITKFLGNKLKEKNEIENFEQICKFFTKGLEVKYIIITIFSKSPII